MIQAVFLSIFAFYVAQVYIEQLRCDITRQAEQRYDKLAKETDDVLEEVCHAIKEVEDEYHAIIGEGHKREDLYLRHPTSEVVEDLCPDIKEELHREYLYLRHEIVVEAINDLEPVVSVKGSNREDLYLRHEITESESEHRTIIEEDNNGENMRLREEIEQTEAEILVGWKSQQTMTTERARICATSPSKPKPNISQRGKQDTEAF